MLNLAHVLEDMARRHPDRIALTFADTHLSYGTLHTMASKLASSLVDAGLQPGDRVALSCPNIPWFPVVYYGILKAGGVAVPLNVLLKRKEIAFHLNEVEAAFFFCFEGSADLPMGVEACAAVEEVPSCKALVIITGDPAAPSPFDAHPTLGAWLQKGDHPFETRLRSSEDTAVILFTSGTTGSPKGAELTHSNMLLNAVFTKDLARYTPDDVILVMLPLFHSFGQTVLMNAALLTGMRLVLMPQFKPAQALALMLQEGVTTFSAVPTMYWGLMQAARKSDIDVSTIAQQLRLCISGGAALPLEVLKGFEDTFDVPILEGYGLSETSPVACFNMLDAPRKPGSIGRPVWGVDMQIVDEQGHPLPPGEPGEVVIRGHVVMKGYFNQPEATRDVLRNHWFHTGDIGKTDEEGYFYIVDRTKDMIIRGGFNIYPREIEETMLTHPAISMVAVIGVPDTLAGENVKAIVVLKPDASLSESELKAWCKEQMASYKFPRYIEFRDSLPMTATGKILKKVLREEHA